MNNEELKKKIAQIIADYFCSQRNEHKNLWGDNRLCYSKMNFAECERVAKCVDALIAAGIGDVTEWKEKAKKHRVQVLPDGTIKQLYSDEEVEDIARQRDEYKHRAEVAEKALNSACFILVKNYYTDGKEDWAKRGAECATFYREQAERELAEEGKE